MAEHLNQRKPDHSDDPMYWMGKPVPVEAREYAMKHAKGMGLDTVHAHALVEKMANALERDEPYEAQKVSMQYVDLTGYYRMMAVILSAVAQIATRPAPVPAECPCDDWYSEFSS